MKQLIYIATILLLTGCAAGSGIQGYAPHRSLSSSFEGNGTLGFEEEDRAIQEELYLNHALDSLIPEYYSVVTEKGL